jgi:adenylate cyclase
VDPAVNAAGGRIIKSMGEGLLIEFPSPVDAVRCVIGTQDRMAAR